MENFNASFRNFGAERSFRQGYSFQKKMSRPSDDCYSFQDLFAIEKGCGTGMDELPNNIRYCQIGDVSAENEPHPVDLDFTERDFGHEKYYRKIESGDITPVSAGEILLPKLISDKMKCVLVREADADIFYTTAFMRLKSVHEPLLMHGVLSVLLADEIKALARQGKIYATLCENDILGLRISKSRLDNVLARKGAIIERLTALDDFIRSNADKTDIELAIDQAFSERFGYDYRKFEEKASLRRFGIAGRRLACDKDLRMGARFCRPATEFVIREISVNCKLKIGDVISAPIMLGSGISPDDYDPDGDACYLAMSAIKSWAIDAGSAKKVKPEYYDALSRRSSVEIGDILMCRSGEGTIGKAALIKSPIKGIFSDFTMRIKADRGKCLPEFLYYYMRTKYFRCLVESFKKGLGNTINIYPSQIRNFPFPCAGLEDQHHIAQVIKKAISTKIGLESKIKSMRDEANTMIRNIAEGAT